VFVQIERRKPDEIQAFACDRLPHVPEWILIFLNPTKKPFWVIPDDHYFEITDGKHGLPQELLAAAHRYAGGDIDLATAEALICELLTIWSRQNEPASD
jgi:hypothetical protein